MLTFTDWKPTSPDQPEVELLQRAHEIKNLVENTQPKVQKIIQKRQETQKKSQDKRNNVATEPLPNGTQVYIQTQKLQSKLKPLYHGAYTVHGRGTNGNYILVNSLGKRLKNTFPLTHLKPVTPEDADTGYEIEQILDHKDEFGTLSYLVKWKDFSDAHNSWVKESNFDTTECIEEYWENKSKPAQVMYTHSNRTRSVPLLVFNKHTILMILLIFFFPMCFCYQIRGTFPVCDSSALYPANTHLNCLLPPNFKPGISRQWHIFDRRLHQIDGTVIQCSKSYVWVTGVRNFINKPETYRSVTPVELTVEECAHMWTSRTCDTYPMECADDYCKYQKEPVPAYNYCRGDHKSQPLCEVVIKNIKLPTVNDTIAIGKNGPCKAHHQHCRFATSLMIWSESIVFPCGYNYVESTRLRQVSNFLVSPKNDTKSTSRYLFQLLESFTSCNITMYSTAEGLYLTSDNVTHLQNGDTPFSTLEHLQLADEDYHIFLLEDIIDSVQRRYAQSLCQQFVNYLTMLKLTVFNTFLPIIDLTGTTRIIYLDNGEVYIPYCTYVQQIEVIQQTVKCYEHVPIRLMSNTTLTAFLNRHGVIQLYSSEVPCTKVVTKFYINSTWLVTRQKGDTWVTPINSSDLFQFNTIGVQYATYDFQHSSVLRNAILERESASFRKTVDTDFAFTITETSFPEFPFHPLSSITDHINAAYSWIQATAIAVVVLIVS